MVYSGKPLICLAEPVSFQIRESNPTVFLGKKMFSNKKMFPQYRIELKEGCIAVITSLKKIPSYKL